MTVYGRDYKQLTFKHKQFIASYVLTGDSTKAAIEAGYSEHTAVQQGCNLMRVPSIKREIDAKLKLLELKSGVSAEVVLKELFAIATSDIRDAFEDDGSFKGIKQIPQMLARTIKNVKIDKQSGKIVDITFYDKTKALELLANHLKLLNNKVEIEVGDNLAELIAQGRQRVAQRTTIEIAKPDNPAIDAIQVEQSSQESSDKTDYMKNIEANPLIGNRVVDDALGTGEDCAGVPLEAISPDPQEQDCNGPEGDQSAL